MTKRKKTECDAKAIDAKVRFRCREGAAAAETRHSHESEGAFDIIVGPLMKA